MSVDLKLAKLSGAKMHLYCSLSNYCHNINPFAHIPRIKNLNFHKYTFEKFKLITQ